MRASLLTLFLFFILGSCSLFKDETKEENINILTDFNNTRGTATVFFGDNTIPLDGMFVSVLKNSIANEIIVNIAPNNSYGSMADIGTGWVQLRFSADVKPGQTQAQKSQYPNTLISSNKLEPNWVEGIYVDDDGKSWELAVGPKVNTVTLDYTSEDEYYFEMSFQGNGFWRPWDESAGGGTKDANMLVSFGVSAEGGGSDSIVGTWTYRQNNCDTDARMTFDADKTGSVFIPDCNHVCADGNVTNFNWSTSGNQLTFDYTEFFICGTEQDPPDGGTVGYTLDGNKLTIGSQTWTRQ